MLGTMRQFYVVAFLLFLAALWLLHDESELRACQSEESYAFLHRNDAHHNYDMMDFEEFNNQVGSEKYIVPNLVHLVYLNETYIDFQKAVNIYSIYLNQRPDYIYIHCDNCTFRGLHWHQINSIKDLKRRIVLKPITFHNSIFGTKYGWVNHHRSDTLRLMVLMSYGGIFLDNDVYVVNSLDKYRKFELVVSWDVASADREERYALGTQVLIANRNARLLKAHFESYRTDYMPSKWYYNAGWAPTFVIHKHPELAHTVKEKLGTHNMIRQLYKMYWPEWKQMDTIHLLINHRFYADPKSNITVFDAKNILTYNYTYGEMCRAVMSRIKQLT